MTILVCNPHETGSPGIRWDSHNPTILWEVDSDGNPVNSHPRGRIKDENDAVNEAMKFFDEKEQGKQ